MKICITSFGSDLDSLIDPRFGRAQFFLILDEEGDLKEVLPNPGIGAMHGAGIAAAQTIASKRVNVLITGNIGPNAIGALITTGIKIFLTTPGISTRDAFFMWKEDKLTQAQIPTVPGHLGGGPPPGPGRPGGGRGRGAGRGRGGPFPR